MITRPAASYVLVVVTLADPRITVLVIGRFKSS
jgi:hypothetical protein